jgi:hypothetical protein
VGIVTSWQPGYPRDSAFSSPQAPLMTQTSSTRGLEATRTKESPGSCFRPGLPPDWPSIRSTIRAEEKRTQRPCETSARTSAHLSRPEVNEHEQAPLNRAERIGQSVFRRP